jgi:5'-nucleotidase
MRRFRPNTTVIRTALQAGVLLAVVSGVPIATPAHVTLSIVGTNDLHGNVFGRNGRGGVAVLGGFINNLRAARAADGGVVVLIDAGDTFQGAVESNLSEGAIVVDAYNALGYAAAAIGNHEFDFGAVDSLSVGPSVHATEDPRGAIKAIAARAKFPFLAANLIDERTGRVVDWTNVKPSVLFDRSGIRIGIVGVMTIGALRATLVVNTRGLRTAPLVQTIAAEAARLRGAGAEVVIVAAHAGGSCAQFDDPSDLASCDDSSEIFYVARELPAGLVDAIVAGHTHSGLAHTVAGIPIVEAYSAGRAFSRVDLEFNLQTRRVTGARPFAPRELCVREHPGTGACEAGSSPSAVPVSYEGRTVAADEAILRAMAPALQQVRELQATPLGPIVGTAIRRAGDSESPLGNLFADAMREWTPGADVGLTISNAPGGLRADLPPGPLTFGALYDAFPFDNRFTRVVLRAGDLNKVFLNEVRRGRGYTLGISGLRVKGGCSPDGFTIELLRPSGEPVGADETLVVAAHDYLVNGAVFAPALASGDFQIPESAPIVIDIVTRWAQQRRGGRLEESSFGDPAERRWDIAGALANCAVPK